LLTSTLLGKKYTCVAAKDAKTGLCFCPTEHYCCCVSIGRVIVKSCGIHKRITIHTFRHCYGAHLVESGVNLRAIQHQMGHECPKTTALYTQLTETTQNNTGAQINGLIDGLDFEVIS
jgi:hypothetical protein